MRTIVKENISFKLNNCNSVDVLKDNIKITSIDLGLHTILCMFSGYLENDEIKKVFEEVFSIDEKRSEILFYEIIKKCNYILQETEITARNLIPFPIENQKINLF